MIRQTDSYENEDLSINGWPDMVVDYDVVKEDDETGWTRRVELNKVVIGDTDMLDCLHDGAKAQLSDDILNHLSALEE